MILVLSFFFVLFINIIVILIFFLVGPGETAHPEVFWEMCLVSNFQRKFLKERTCKNSHSLANIGNHTQEQSQIFQAQTEILQEETWMPLEQKVD